MKLSHLLGAVFLTASETTLVRAADCVNVALGAIPSCAQSCFLNGAPSVGCGGTDFACQCEQEARLYAAIEGCVSSGCPSASYQAVIDGASTVCDCATAGSGGGGLSVSGSFIGSMPATTTGSAIQGRSSGTVIPQPGGGSSAATTTPATISTPAASPSASSTSGAGRPGFSMAATSAVVALLAFVSL